jgi:hypothetical protein
VPAIGQSRTFTRRAGNFTGSSVPVKFVHPIAQRTTVNDQSDPTHAILLRNLAFLFGGSASALALTVDNGTAVAPVTGRL